MVGFVADIRGVDVSIPAVVGMLVGSVSVTDGSTRKVEVTVMVGEIEVNAPYMEGLVDADGV